MKRQMESFLLDGFSGFLNKRMDIEPVFEVKLSPIEKRLVSAIFKEFENFCIRDCLVSSNCEKELFSIVPRIRMTYSEILDMLGKQDRENINIEKLTEALKNIKKNKFRFQYTHFRKDKNNFPIRSKEGNWKQLSTECKNSLFKLAWVYDQSKLKYIEITPSDVFFDQIEMNYVSIADKFIEKFRCLSEKKSISPTITYMFLYLCQKLISKPNKMGELIQVKWNELAKIIKIPEKTIREGKAISLRRLEQAFFSAKKVGLVSFWMFKYDVFSFTTRKIELEKELPKNII